jgi:hypothetical protein
MDATGRETNAVDALEKIAIYAEGMMRHYEQHGFGEARSWRIIVITARRALGEDPTPTAGRGGEPAEREMTDDQLERLLRVCRAEPRRASGPLFEPDEVPGLIEQLVEELLLWRRGHPEDLPGG